MKITRVPAHIYRVGCLGCRALTEVPVFQGDGFCNFGTYRGSTTGRFYRVDLDRVFYLKVPLKTELERAAAQNEAGVPLELVPDEMRCPTCGERIGLSGSDLRTMPTPLAQRVTAVLL